MNINNIDNAKIRYIFSMLDNQIEKGNKELVLHLNDYDFVANQLKEIFEGEMKPVYKGYIIKLTN